LPAKKIAPPLETWIITGALKSRAASITAFVLSVQVTLIAGMANPFCLAYASNFCNWSPESTPAGNFALIILTIKSVVRPDSPAAVSKIRFIFNIFKKNRFIFRCEVP